MKPHWNIEQLKAQLFKHKAVKFWIIVEENTRRRERYFLLEQQSMLRPSATEGLLAVDQDRDVTDQSISVKIAAYLPAASSAGFSLGGSSFKPDRQGEIIKKFFTSLPLAPQIESAIEAAQQTDHQAWNLPTAVPAELPLLKSADPKIAEDIEGVLGEVTDQISKSVTAERPTVFSSAELFISLHSRCLHLSNGLVHRSSQSRIYTEAAFSMTGKDRQGNRHSDEYLNTKWSVSVNELEAGRVFNDSSERAQYSIDVEKPETGKYWVLIDSEILAMIFNDAVPRLSAPNAYHGLPFVKPGEVFVPNAQGDLLTLTLDPHLEYGADTTVFSEQGVLQKRLTLVDSNRVVATATDKQYADYLGTEANTVRGSVVLSAGKLTHAELTCFAPKVIEILQLSGLFSDANSGTFGSEIRLAKLYDKASGTTRFIKGGSLSCSMVENFSKARFSNKLVKKSLFSANSTVGHGYYGPEYALLNDVSIVG